MNRNTALYLAAVSAHLSIVGCVTTPYASPGALAAFGVAQLACVSDNDSGVAIDACRAQSLASFCATNPGFSQCPTDGGAQ